MKQNVTLNLLKEKDENYILDEILIPALDKVGKDMIVEIYFYHN